MQQNVEVVNASVLYETAVKVHAFPNEAAVL
jgi:hypothetical protein